MWDKVKLVTQYSVVLFMAAIVGGLAAGTFAYYILLPAIIEYTM